MPNMHVDAMQLHVQHQSSSSKFETRQTDVRQLWLQLVAITRQTQHAILAVVVLLSIFIFYEGA